MRFQIGDKVHYTGKKFVSDIGNSVGEVVSRVANSDTHVVVDFGSDAYVVNEVRNLKAFQGHLKGEGHDQKGNVDVQKRRRPKKEDASSE